MHIVNLRHVFINGMSKYTINNTHTNNLSKKKISILHYI